MSTQQPPTFARPSSALPSRPGSAAPYERPPLSRQSSVDLGGNPPVTATATNAFLEKYEIMKDIGTGTFGKVFKVQRRGSDEIMVAKELYYGDMNEKEKQQLVSEVNILRDLNHKHIVKYCDRIIVQKQHKIYIVMEYCSGGELLSYIKEHQKAKIFIPEESIWRFLFEISQALLECHRKKGGTILHRDIKPANIFLDASLSIKLGDFGLARTLKDSMEFARTNVGTPYYMSPEQVMEKIYNESSDIWSLGCLIYEIANLSPPFTATNQLALANKIKVGTFDRIPRHYSDELDKFIKLMICVKMEERPDMEAIVKYLEVREKEQAMIRELCNLQRNKEALYQTMKSLQQRELRRISSAPISNPIVTVPAPTKFPTQYLPSKENAPPNLLNRFK